jgi:hypothetical protein
MEHSESWDSTDGGAEIVQETSLRVSCFWCERLHPGEHLLAVCPACAAKYATMRALETSGSYPLGAEARMRTSPGNHALGYMDGEAFGVFYVGRWATDPRRRLQEWVGMPSPTEIHGSFANVSWGMHRRGLLPMDAPALGRVGNAECSDSRFSYSYARSAEDAYEYEWRNYDAFGGSHGLDNETEPVLAAA